MNKTELIHKISNIESKFWEIGGNVSNDFDSIADEYLEEEELQYWSQVEEHSLRMVFQIQQDLIKKYKLEKYFDVDYNVIEESVVKTFTQFVNEKFVNEK